ncbi:MAG: EamA family transporter [Candidatus Omnitrophota bacterium]
MNAFGWALATALIWGAVPILEKLGLAKTAPTIALFYRSLGVVIGLIFLGLFAVKPAELKAVDTRSIFLLVLAGFLASFVAQITFYNGLKMGEVSKVVPISGSYHLIAFFLSILLLGETLTVIKLVGVFLIVSGVWLLR